MSSEYPNTGTEAPDTFENDLGEQQALFTATGQQLLRPEMYADTADTSFYVRYARPGVKRSLREGLLKETKDLGGDLKDGIVSGAKAIKDHPGQALRALGEALIETPGAIVDGFVESGHALGEGAAVAFNDDIGAKLNTLYGTDVGSVQGTLLGLKAVVAVAGATGASKVVTQVGKAGGKLVDDVAERIEVKELKNVKEKEIAERKETLSVEKDSFELENRPAKERSLPSSPDDVSKEIQRLATEGHGVQRHGAQVTLNQLESRVLEGSDPITGTSVDGVHGGKHQYAQHATKVTSDEAYVFAEKYARGSQKYIDATSQSVTGRAEVKIPLRDIYGDDFREYVSGVTRYGSKEAPTGFGSTIFPDDSYMVVRYKQDSTGKWLFNTMFPQPK